MSRASLVSAHRVGRFNSECPGSADYVISSNKAANPRRSKCPRLANKPVGRATRIGRMPGAEPHHFLLGPHDQAPTTVGLIVFQAAIALQAVFKPGWH